MTTSEPVVIFATCNDKEKAEMLAGELVQRRLAACVNVTSGISSYYRWHGRIKHDSEVLLIIKSTGQEIDSITQLMRDLSGYEVPEVVAVDVAGGNHDYLEWLQTETGGV